MAAVTIKINNCTECPAHKVLPDPDPNDWFNVDDVKVVCTRKDDKSITVACRPHRIEKECSIPHWCPISLVNKEKEV